jgi:hypothetical protein
MSNNNKRGGCNITVVIQDENWNKLATFKWNTGDLKRQYAILKTIEDAFGINFKKKTDMSWVN